jgi:Fe/S biogenesis protein NfuA
MDKVIEITGSAKDYLVELLAKQDTPGIGVRVFVQQPGTPQAETCLAYCRPGEEQEGDIELEDMPFPVHVQESSIPFLEEAVIDYSADSMGGQLTIKAPNSKLPKVDENSSIEDKINYVLWTEVNPMLASHGGEVSLVDLVEENIAVLRFGGGCQGCSAVDITLKDGVEKTLLEQIPELKAVRDVTDHTDRSQAFY